MELLLTECFANIFIQKTIRQVAPEIKSVKKENPVWLHLQYFRDFSTAAKCDQIEMKPTVRMNFVCSLVLQ